MTTLAIARLSSRVTSPDAETALAVAPLLDGATRFLPRSLEALMPRAMAAAGLPPEAVVGLRRLDLRLRATDAMDAGTLARHWADAILAALTAELRSIDIGRIASAPKTRCDVAGALAEPTDGGDATRDDAGIVAFADSWRAEAAWLRHLAAGLPPPWWQDALSKPPAGAYGVIAGWIEREPGRAAIMLLDLLLSTPNLSSLLSPREASWLSAVFLRRLRTATTAYFGADNRHVGSVPLATLPASVRRALALVAPDTRAPFLVAAALTHLPAWTPVLARSDAAEFVSATTRDAFAEAEPLATAERPLRAEAAGVAVLQGGLLLLLRPLAESGLLDRLGGDALPAALLDLGLAALRRTLAPLPLALRRTLLERDRPLLSVFAGAALPEAPLDTVVIPADAEQRLDALMDRAPDGVAWAPGALRAGHGGTDPFGDTRDGALARILLRPARLGWTRWSADLTWPPASADIALRRAGWDIDPGWLPWIGRGIRFHYDGPDDAP
jgi:hypothetical protein